MPYFKTSDACRLFFEYQRSADPKPAVVFLNGTMQTTVNWKTISNILKDEFQVITFDARGQGKSDLGEKPLSLPLHSEDLHKLIDHLGITRAHLAGLSHGAGIALHFASLYPERAERLILCSTGARLTCRAMLAAGSWHKLLKTRGVEAMVWTALPLMFSESFLWKNKNILPKMVKAIVRRNKQEALTAHFEAVIDYPPLSTIAPGVHLPALVISGSDDPLVSEDGARDLAALCNADYQYVRGVGHSIPAEAPELFTGILREFLAN